MKAAWKSDTGRVRENNEDSVLVDAELGIFLLADGMGGARGGEVASGMAVRAAYDHLMERVKSTELAGIPRLLAEALAAAHSAVFRRGLEEPELEGMGTTLEIAVVKEGKAYICHVGDSRVYFFSAEKLERITSDDNVAARLAEEHVPEEDIPPEARHILTQAVGVSRELVPQLHALELRERDLIILCSDGLTGMLSDEDMEGILRQERGDLDKAADALVSAANARGGFDNVSVVLVEPQAVPVAPPQKALLPAIPRGATSPRG